MIAGLTAAIGRFLPAAGGRKRPGAAVRIDLRWVGDAVTVTRKNRDKSGAALSDRIRLLVDFSQS